MLEDQSSGSLGDVWEKNPNPAVSQEQGPSPERLSLAPLSWPVAVPVFGVWEKAGSEMNCTLRVVELEGE